ncbi:lipoyl(octanoyl) transferase LipB [Singulisphaera sp. PoT]|uniref:lipoyl(octanoyl) transferase LipB n=1 Tax=Singulisphaera sp. PoT TaxID=3411797 RepID=UPI003BF5259D
MTVSPSTPSLEIYLLGLVEFEDVQLLQRRLVYEHGERGGASVILCEHPPTISVGRSGSRAHIALDDEELRSLEIGVHWVNRGGGCVLHLPGQLSAYVVLNLDMLGQDVKRYIDGLNNAIIGVLNEFELRGETKPDHPGVFLGNSRIASVGIAVSRWVAYHGFTLNVGAFLGPFDLIDEPGFGPHSLRQTSMESRRQRPAPMAKVRESLIRHLELSFGLERHHIYSHHPLIRRKVRSHVYAQSTG